MTDEPTASDIADAWTPDGVIRVIRELADHGVHAFALRVESAGLEIAIDRGGGMPGWPGRGDQHVPQPREPESAEKADDPHPDEYHTITAPLLGTFWRKPSPEEPDFVAPGDTIERGQTVGLIEVMKSFHEVTASGAGIVRRVLVGDGETVEYGQPLVELGPISEG